MGQQTSFQIAHDTESLRNDAQARPVRSLVYSSGIEATLARMYVDDTHGHSCKTTGCLLSKTVRSWRDIRVT